MPELAISLDLADDRDFRIEELTFNPFMSLRSFGLRHPSLEIWMELVLRRSGSGPADKEVPNIFLRFTEPRSTAQRPTCRLSGTPASSDHLADDMNYVLHSDIWYSVVRISSQDREFMTKGYNQPIRLLYPCLACEHSSARSNSVHANHEDWMKCKNTIFEDKRYEPDASHLLLMMQYFNGQVIHTQSARSQWVEDVQVVAGEEWPVCIPRNDDRLAPVPFEVPIQPVRARFALRRLPWKMSPHEAEPHMYGISYGGTVVVKEDTDHYRLEPHLFAVDAPELIPAVLRPHEAIRFWIRWESRNAVMLDTARERLSFVYRIRSAAAIDRFNTFFHVPIGFARVPGTATQLEHYPVPPRLFFLWDEYPPEQVFSHHSVHSQTSDPDIELFTTFYDTAQERRRLADIFVLALLVNALVGLGLTALFQSLPHRGFMGFLHLSFSPFLAAFLVTLTAIRAYQGLPFRWSGVVYLVLVSFLTAPAYELGLLAFLLVSSLTVLGVFWTQYRLGLLIRRVANKRNLPGPLRRLLDRRRHRRARRRARKGGEV